MIISDLKISFPNTFYDRYFKPLQCDNIYNYKLIPIFDNQKVHSSRHPTDLCCSFFSLTLFVKWSSYKCCFPVFYFCFILFCLFVINSYFYILRKLNLSPFDQKIKK